jgi:hypothetical protein
VTRKQPDRNQMNAVSAWIIRHRFVVSFAKFVSSLPMLVSVYLSGLGSKVEACWER